jgi:hypothetical protein
MTYCFFLFELQIPMQLKEGLKSGTLSLRDLDNKVSQLIEFLESEYFKAKRRAKVAIYIIHNYSMLFKIHVYYYCREEPEAREGAQRRQELWIGNHR